MSDLRDKEPKTRALDFVSDTFGSATWEAKIHVWTYSSIKNEDVYSREVVVRFRAERMRHAVGFAESISETIKAAHDVWETGVDAIVKIGGS